MLTWIIAPALITFGFVCAIAATVIARHRKGDHLKHRAT
jgi:hypothetical protein